MARAFKTIFSTENNGLNCLHKQALPLLLQAGHDQRRARAALAAPRQGHECRPARPRCSPAAQPLPREALPPFRVFGAARVHFRRLSPPRPPPPSPPAQCPSTTLPRQGTKSPAPELPGKPRWRRRRCRPQARRRRWRPQRCRPRRRAGARSRPRTGWPEVGERGARPLITVRHCGECTRARISGKVTQQVARACTRPRAEA
jgi:hypothetical protein